jgi:hypothetical protein
MSAKSSSYSRCCSATCPVGMPVICKVSSLKSLALRILARDILGGFTSTHSSSLYQDPVTYALSGLSCYIMFIPVRSLSISSCSAAWKGFACTFTLFWSTGPTPGPDSPCLGVSLISALAPRATDVCIPCPACSHPVSF